MGIKTVRGGGSRSKYKRLVWDVEENNGLATGEKFDREREFHEFLHNWLQGRTLYFKGQNAETAETKKWDKKRESRITNVDINPKTGSGYGDIGIEHQSINLAWNHILGNPFIIECKLGSSFKEGVAQAVRYKNNSEQKYEERGEHKVLKTGIATPVSLSTGELTSRPSNWKDTGYDPYHVNFEAKRIYWKLGVGVVQSIHPDTLVISFNEGDVVVIK